MGPGLSGVESGITVGGKASLPTMLGWVGRLNCFANVWAYENEHVTNRCVSSDTTQVMNWCITGYKLRKHIATALWARSQAICNSLDRYNVAASALSPPRANLSWNDVVEYAFLADFDLLRDSRDDVRDRPWTKPAFHVIIDQHFKLLRAWEEIQRLNVEIRHVVTYIQDEDRFLQVRKEELKATNIGLAYQITKYQLERGRFNDGHMRWFRKLAALPEFTGSIEPGISMNSHKEAEVAMKVDEQLGGKCPHDIDISGNGGDSDSDEGEDDQEDDDISAVVSALFSLSIDKPGVE
jgi:hypothetical protein